MYFTFSKNPINRIKIWFWNKLEEYFRKVWQKNTRYYVQCRICGEILRSANTDYSPIEAGWDRMKNHSIWICHRCMSHRNFKPYIDKIDEDERRVWEQIES